MSLDFTAVDFETANSYRGSPCSVGLVKVHDGQVVDTAHWLIRPPAAYDYFHSFNTMLHGISAETVANSPRWKDVLPNLVDFVDGDTVIAHNAGFDLGVVRYACVADGIHWPTMDFLCTLVLARRAFQLPSYRLPFVTQACGATITGHHHAAADAEAAARVAVALARRQGVDRLDDLANHFAVRVGRMDTGFYQPSLWKRPNNGLVATEANKHADPDHPLYGRVIVFTGALASMTRQQAWEEVARVGGIAEKQPTKRTNVLVVGDINPAVLAPGCVLTGKARRAFELQDQGYDIELMTEDDFLRAL